MSKVIIQNVRIGFVKVFKPEGYKGSDQNKKYSLELYLDPTNASDKKALKQIKKAMNETGQAKFGDKWNGGKMKVKGYALKSADEDIGGQEQFVELYEPESGEVPEHLEGLYILRASENTRPTVVNRDKTPLTEEDGVLYGGCYATVIITFWAQSNDFGKRINANLVGVQFKKDGERFGEASARAEDDDFDDDFEDDDDDL